MKETVSICPICYKTIPAVICAAVMVKVCPEHGDFAALVESDKGFYDYWTANNSSTIYDGHLVDVTTRCNLKCKYCYFDKGDTDIPIETILAECGKAKGPYILTGGEPTLRKDMHEIIDQVKAIGQPNMLTNGYGLRLKDDLLKYAKQLKNPETGVIEIGLSYHAEAPWLPEVLKNIIECDLQLQTLFFVVDELSQLAHVKQIAERLGDSFVSYRIKLAAGIWAEKQQTALFASDVVNWFMAQGETTFPNQAKITFLPFIHNGITYAVIKWYSAENVDLQDIATAPTYTAKNGQVMDFVSAMLYNEGHHDKASH